jgi:hypothetical protein
MVAFERMPKPWAMRWISSQRSAPALPVKRSAFWSRAEKIASPGHRVEPGGLQAGQGLARLDLPAAPEIVDLSGGERLDLGIGSGGVDRLHEPLVVLERPVRVVAAHDMDLADVRLDHSNDVLDGVLERAGLALLLGEVAERA